MAPLNWRLRKMPSGSIGCGLRSSSTRNAGQQRPGPPTDADGRALDEAVGERGPGRPRRPAAPWQVEVLLGRGCGSRARGGRRRAPPRRTGRFTKNASRHETLSISQPPRNGPDGRRPPRRGPTRRPTALARSSGWNTADEDRQAPRHEQRGADALEAPGRAMSTSTFGASRAQRRGAGEPGEAEQEHPPPAEAVAQRAAEEHQRAERDEVGVEHPLEVGSDASRSSAIAGSATLTMVPSRKATPDPRTVASRTQRASRVPMRTGTRLRPRWPDQAGRRRAPRRARPRSW